MEVNFYVLCGWLDDKWHWLPGLSVELLFGYEQVAEADCEYPIDLQTGNTKFRFHKKNIKACLKKAFCKMWVTICGNDFSNTL